MAELGLSMNRPDFEQMLNDYNIRPIRNERPKSKRFYPLSEMPSWLVQSLLDVRHFRETLAQARHPELADVAGFLRWRAEREKKAD